MTDDATSEIEALLRQHPLFHAAGADVIETLANSSTARDLSTGDVLMAEGDAGNDAFVVVGGRLAVTAGERLVGRVGRGDVVGEMALLTDAARSATVTATRASQVIRIDGVTFSRLLAHDTDLQRRVSALLVERLRAANIGQTTESRGRVLAVVVDPREITRSFVADIVGSLERSGRSTARYPVSDADLDVSALAAAETEHDVVVLVPDPARHDAIAAAVRHADRVLVVVDGGGAPQSASALRLDDGTADIELVVMHAPEIVQPQGTHRWLAQLRPTDHHHVRSGDRAHTDRLVRRLFGGEIGLVLGGGGARGLAHLGTYRALVEADVPIDVIAGVSSGSIVAAALGAGWTPAEADEIFRSMLVEAKSPVDATLPTVAIASGRRITERLRTALGGDDLRLEDLWLPTMIVSANLTTADVHEHRTGPVWRAVRASIAIPGVFPPMVEPEGLLVDGGLVDNLPVARFRAKYPKAIVISSDVGRRVEFLAGRFPPDGIVSGWKAWPLRRRWRRQRIPGLAALLSRLTALGSAGVAAEPADVAIEHDLDGFGMFDFTKGAAIAEAGYKGTQSVLADLDAATLPLGDALR